MPNIFTSDQIVELKAGGPGDADDSRAAALAAYIHAEHARAFRRLLWRRLAMVAGVWFVLGTLKVIPTVGVSVGLTLFGLIAVGAGVVDRAAGRKLDAALREAGQDVRHRSF